MMKQLTVSGFGLALVFAVACKTDPPSPAANPTPSTDQPGAAARSAKIDVKPVLPATPDPAAAPAPADDHPRGRGEWRKHRDDKADANGDGVVSDDERAAAMRERMSEMRTRLDTDGDGKLSPAELANARGRMRFDDPSALDTNHDGDISADELAAGLKARRDARRAGSGGGAQTTP